MQVQGFLEVGGLGEFETGFLCIVLGTHFVDQAVNFIVNFTFVCIFSN